jgi:hypothetical protein
MMSVTLLVSGGQNNKNLDRPLVRLYYGWVGTIQQWTKSTT